MRGVWEREACPQAPEWRLINNHFERGREVCTEHLGFFHTADGENVAIALRRMRP